MNPSPAEQSFKKGLAALAEERPAEAAERFLAAMQLEWKQSARPRDMRYLSYYGLSLARARHAISQAVEACEYAVSMDRQRPSLLLNLGLVYRMAGKTIPALDCFERGLSISPEHPGLLRALSEVDRRSTPPIRSLKRSHPFNRYAGRIRASVRAHLGTTVPEDGEHIIHT